MDSHHFDLSIMPEITGDYIVVIDKDATISFANEAARAFFKFSSCNIIGRKCHLLCVASEVPRGKNDTSFFFLFDEVIRTGNTASITHSVSLSDGMKKTYEITASPINNRYGEVQQVLEVIRDITARQEAEKAILDHHEFLSSVLEGIGDGVIVLNRNLEILSANKGYLQQVGKKIKDVIGQHCFSLSHNLNTPCYNVGEECAVNRSFSTGNPGVAVHRHGKNNSAPMYVETKSYPLKDRSGKVTQVIEVISDITEKYTLEEELKKRVKELEEFYDMAVERELKMVELKQDISRLEEKLHTKGI